MRRVPRTAPTGMQWMACLHTRAWRACCCTRRYGDKANLNFTLEEVLNDPLEVCWRAR